MVMDDPNPQKRVPADETSNPKRSRGLGVVTPNACTECRKKRAKCDGQKPCTRCKSQKDVNCVYEVPVRQSKENMRAEIEQLRKHQRQTESILGALTTKESVDIVLEQIQRGQPLEKITESLDKSAQSGSSADSTVTTYMRYCDQQAINNALNPARTATVTNLSSSSNILTLNDQSSLQQQQRNFQQGGPIRPAPRQMQSTTSTNSNSWHSSQDSPSAAVSGSSTSRQEDMMQWESESTQSNSMANYDTLPLVGNTFEETSGPHPQEDFGYQARGHGQETILGEDFGGEERINPALSSGGSWTTVTSDIAFVEHLMALYFCWEYPTFASLSKEHFLEDFRRGNGTNCSSLLVNSILALGCRFSSHPNSRSDPNDKDTAGNHFFAEATRLLNMTTDRHQLTTIQALGLMAIREASCGRSSQSIFLSGQSIRLAIEMGLHSERVQDLNGLAQEADQAVRAATFWGAFSLDQAWSVSIGRLPCFSQDIKLVSKPGLVDHVEKSAWVPYTDEGIPVARNCTQPSNVRSVFQTFCELSEIVHKHLYAFYSPSKPLRSKILLDVYTQYLNWYEAIPSALRLGQNFTPAVLFAHMYYHYAILLLFRPFLKMEISGSSVVPQDVCNQAGDAISALVHSYSQLYTLRRTPSFVPYFVLTSSITHLVGVGITGRNEDKLVGAVDSLKQMTECHGFAYRALDILQFLTHHWKVDSKVGNRIDVQNTDTTKLCLPRSESMNEFCPNIEGTHMMNGIDNPESDDENALFWVFPLQGRPLLAVERDALELAGFRVRGKELSMDIASTES